MTVTNKPPFAVAGAALALPRWMRTQAATTAVVGIDAPSGGGDTASAHIAVPHRA